MPQYESSCVRIRRYGLEDLVGLTEEETRQYVIFGTCIDYANGFVPALHSITISMA
jgi:hypothetical protein